MSTINEKQLEKNNLQYKFCFGYLYNRAKVLYHTNLAVSLAIPVVSLMTKMLQYDIKDVILSISSCWIIMALVLNTLEQNIRLKATTLQEKYDNNVFGLMENKTLLLKQITHEEVHFISKKNNETKESLYYSDLDSNDKMINVLLAQRQNILSDRLLRERYLIFYIIFLLIIVLLCFVFGILLGQTLKEFLIGMLIPTISLISLITQQIKKLSDEIKKNNQIGKLIESDFHEYSKMILGEIGNSNYQAEYLLKCREYQNYIFTKRLNASLIPNFIYGMFKKGFMSSKDVEIILTSKVRDV